MDGADKDCSFGRRLRSAGCGMELFGNRQAVIEGCSGILEYESELVRVRAGKTILRIKGRGLLYQLYGQCVPRASWRA